MVKCVNAVNPDLIAITGDALSPVFVTSGTRNSYRQTAVLTALFEKLKVPYAFCFGNHDGDGTAGKAYVAERLEAAPYSLFYAATDRRAKAIIALK
ncbi:MAG: metallophosphoesterase family protein [Christensenellales bacterium]